MSVDRACILLLSTKTWDLSGGRKGGFQSYREPLSIFELITAVFLLLLYILSFSNKRIDLISFYWFKIGSIIKIKTKLYIHHSLVQHHMVYLIGESSLHQFELFKSFNGSDIYLTASVGIVHEDLDRVFTVKGNGNGIYSIESFDGPIMLLSTPNGLHAYSHIKNKKYNLKQLKKLINSLKINGPAPRLDLVTIYFQMKKIKTSFNILVRIGGPYPSHMKLVTTISLLLYVLLIYSITSFEIVHNDLNPAFIRLKKRFKSFKNRIKLLFTFTGDPFLDGLIFLFESFNGCIMLLTILNGNIKALENISESSQSLIELDLVDPNSFQMAIQFILSKIYTILSCNSGTANSAQKVVKNSTKLFIYSLINSVVKDRRHLIAIFINLKWSISNYIMCFILYRKAIISCTNIATVWLLQCKESKGIIITYKSKNCYKLFFIKILNKNKVVYKGLYNLSLELDGLQHRIDNFVSIQMTTMKNRWLCEIYKFLILCVRNIKSSFKDLFINEIMFVFCTPKKKKKK
eukprot:551494_1